MVYVRAGTVSEEPGIVTKVLDLPYRIYQFLMFFVMTLIDVRTHAHTPIFLLPLRRDPNLLTLSLFVVAAVGGQKSLTDGQQKPRKCAETRRHEEHRWWWRRLRSRGRMRFVSVAEILFAARYSPSIIIQPRCRRPRKMMPCPSLLTSGSRWSQRGAGCPHNSLWRSCVIPSTKEARRRRAPRPQMYSLCGRRRFK